MLKEQVAKNSKEKAVITETDSITYQELDFKSSRLAYHLKVLGIKNGDLVGLCCQTDISFIIGILGILKSGGTYLPLDPNYPKELLDHIVKNSNPRIILVQEEFKDL